MREGRTGLIESWTADHQAQKGLINRSHVLVMSGLGGHSELVHFEWGQMSARRDIKEMSGVGMASPLGNPDVS